MATRSIPEIFTDLLRQFTALMRTEARLARAEVSENLRAAAVGLGPVVHGAVVLLEAAVAALQKYGLESYWAALPVGGGALLIGFILMALGMRRLSVRRL